jgi:putative DNA primase/helicase
MKQVNYASKTEEYSNNESDKELQEILSEVEEIVTDEEEAYGSTDMVPANPGLTSADILHALKSNEDGDAWLLRGLKKNEFCYDHRLGQWFRWEGHFWKEDDVGEVWAALDCVIEKYIEEAARQAQARHSSIIDMNKDHEKKADALEKEILKRINNLQTRYRKQNILNLAALGKSSLGITGKEWDSRNMLLACPNGIIDLRSGRLRDGRPEEYIKTVIPTEWKGSEEKAPLWEKFLMDIFENDKEMVGYIQRLLGYCITGETRDQIIVILYGPNGRNGKSTITEILRHILSPLAGPIQAEMLLSDGRPRSSSGPSPDIMDLRGKRLAWASESEEGRKLAVARVKLLTGADSLTARPPHGIKMIDFSPTHKLFLLTNRMPSLSGADYAMADRLHLITFNLSYVDNPQKPFERKRDPLLMERLKAEASGILAWLVKGCLEWQRIGLKPPKKVLMATAQYHEEEDILGHFLNECVQPDPNGKILARAFYLAYKSWCEEYGHTPTNDIDFGRKVTGKYDKKGGSKGIIYLGISLVASHPEQGKQD